MVSLLRSLSLRALRSPSGPSVSESANGRPILPGGGPPHGRVAALAERIRSHDARVAVVGQGYVGFPLAQTIASAGFATLGYDIDARALAAARRNSTASRYEAVGSAHRLQSADVIIIAVPTPTRDEGGVRQPDLGYVISAVQNVVAHLPADNAARLLVLESTYAPGTTREVVGPLVARWHRLGTDILLGYSPERIDPGNSEFGLSNTPKVVSGLDEQAAELTALFYSQVVRQVIPASSVEAAEATKLLENTFRFVNITFVQEFDEYCEAAGLDASEVIGLAASKPFGFMPFQPGPGIGGHCIAEDPYYLYEAIRRTTTQAAILESAIRNHEMRAEVLVRRIRDRLAPAALAASRVLLLGVAYKPNIADARQSPAADLLDRLEAAGARIDYHDPFVDQFQGRSSRSLDNADPGSYDLAVVMTRHSVFDIERLTQRGWHVFDAWETPARTHPSLQPVERTALVPSTAIA